MRIIAQILNSLFTDHTPATVRRCNTKSDIGQECFLEDRSRNCHTQVCNKHSKDIRNNMFDNNRKIRYSEHFRRHDEILLLDPVNLTTDKTTGTDPSDNAHCDDQRRHAFPKYHHNKDRNNQTWNTIEQINDSPEIIGKPADVPWAFVFERVDMLPRHPAQLYEAIAYFIFFLGMVYLYRRGQKQQENKLKTDFSTTKAKSTAVQTGATLPYHRGFFFGLCLTEIFVFRFFIEFLKEDQVDFESAMTLNMGQWLSIPFILIGVYFMCFHGKKTAGK